MNSNYQKKESMLPKTFFSLSKLLDGLNNFFKKTTQGIDGAIPKLDALEKGIVQQKERYEKEILQKKEESENKLKEYDLENAKLKKKNIGLKREIEFLTPEEDDEDSDVENLNVEIEKLNEVNKKIEKEKLKLLTTLCKMAVSKDLKAIDLLKKNHAINITIYPSENKIHLKMQDQPGGEYECTGGGPLPFTDDKEARDFEVLSQGVKNLEEDRVYIKAEVKPID